MKTICLLGATGSIGMSTCDVIMSNPDSFVLKAVSCNHKIDSIRTLLNQFKSIEYACIVSEDISDLRNEFPNVVFFEKESGIIDLIEKSNCDMVVNALVGFAGLMPTVYSIEHDFDIALANKESLVVGGELINKLLKKHPNAHLYPIDSEHVALKKCLKNKDINDVKKLIITASGGAFRDLKKEELKNVTVAQALNHPTWQMGEKITIDSANLVNKAFEIIEAYHLFHFDESKIEVLLHDESYIHSLILMNDNSFVADIGPRDMQIPISYALFEENVYGKGLPSIDLSKINALHFRPLDESRYPALKIARRVLKEGGILGCIMNAANEAANLAFRENRLPFYQIEEVIEHQMDRYSNIKEYNLLDLINIHHKVYQETEEYIKEVSKIGLY